MKELSEKIEEMNKACKGTLSITHYSAGWQLDSYGYGTMFEKAYVYAETIIEVIEKAWAIYNERRPL